MLGCDLGVRFERLKESLCATRNELGAGVEDPILSVSTMALELGSENIE